MTKEPETKEYSKEKMEFIQRAFDVHKKNERNGKM